MQVRRPGPPAGARYTLSRIRPEKSCSGPCRPCSTVCCQVSQPRECPRLLRVSPRGNGPSDQCGWGKSVTKPLHLPQNGLQSRFLNPVRGLFGGEPLAVPFVGLWIAVFQPVDANLEHMRFDGGLVALVMALVIVEMSGGFGTLDPRLDPGLFPRLLQRGFDRVQPVDGQPLGTIQRPVPRLVIKRTCRPTGASR